MTIAPVELIIVIVVGAYVARLLSRLIEIRENTDYHVRFTDAFDNSAREVVFANPQAAEDYATWIRNTDRSVDHVQVVKGSRDDV